MTLEKMHMSRQTPDMCWICILNHESIYQLLGRAINCYVMVCAPGVIINKINHRVNVYRFFYLLRQHQCGKLPPPARCSNDRSVYIDQCVNWSTFNDVDIWVGPTFRYLHTCILIGWIWISGSLICTNMPSKLTSNPPPPHKTNSKLVLPK